MRGSFGGLGTFDIVYSWGVLHHTGDVWCALELTTGAVAPGGSLFISIYNDRGRSSRRWRQIKRVYNRLPSSLRTPYVMLMMSPSELAVLGRYLLRLRPHAVHPLVAGGRWAAAWHEPLA